MKWKDKIANPAHGVFVGVLMEDMITTVQNTGQLYCNCWIPEFYDKTLNYPLTRVPLQALSLPLRKDDKVLVEFYQNDPTMPVLYKNYGDIDSGFYEQFELGTTVEGGGITVPEAQPTVSAQRLGPDSYVINTDNYTVIHRGEGFILIDNDGNEYVKGKTVNIIGSESVNIDTKKYSLKGSSTSMYKILSDILNILNLSLATQGSPGAHTVVPHQFDTIINDLNSLME